MTGSVVLPYPCGIPLSIVALPLLPLLLLLLRSCPTLSDPTDCSPPGSSIHGIFQARVLEWGAVAFSAVITSSISNSQTRLDARRWVRCWGGGGPSFLRLPSVITCISRRFKRTCGLLWVRNFIFHFYVLRFPNCEIIWKVQSNMKNATLKVAFLDWLKARAV